MLLLYVVLGMEIYITHVYTFIINLLFTVHDKIIMLMGTWRTTRETVLPQGWYGTPLAD
jgi:predicted ferric reductase